MSTIDNTWRIAIDSYLDFGVVGGAPKTTLRLRQDHMQHLARRVDLDPFELETDDLIEYAKAQTWAQETRRGRRNSFLSFYRWAIATNRTDDNPAEGLPVIPASQPNPTPCPAPIYHRALMQADDDEREWLELAHDFGLRRAEIAVVHASDLFEDLEGWSLLVHGKGGKLRTMPLDRSMALKLRTRAHAVDGGYLYPGADDGHVSPRWVGRRGADLLGGDWTIHKLRHSAGQNWYDATDGDYAAVQDLLGHANPGTTRLYVKPGAKRLRSVMQAAVDANRGVNATLTPNRRALGVA